MGRFFSATALAASLLQGAYAQSTNGTGVTCPSTAKFSSITASKFFAALNPGWNLGNTLDAVETVSRIPGTILHINYSDCLAPM